jgi:hypothetical protein
MYRGGLDRHMSNAWNAWRKGEKTDLRYYTEAPVPAAR